jgi:spermidine synthase
MIDDSWDKKDGKTILIDGELVEELKSPYQHIEVFQTKYFGKLLRLDGVIQMTEFDEANYHEMIAHVPLCVHPAPINTLVIGGGDGGAVREILKHKGVQKIDLVEIDKAVINISKKFFPDVASGLDNNIVTIINEDGAKYIKQCDKLYDIIIIDSTDPFSVGASLFRESFYANLKKAIKPRGIIVSQSESMFYHKDLIKKMADFKKKYFQVVKYYHTMVPTYPSGSIGFHFCSQSSYPLQIQTKIKGLKYYNDQIHKSSFITPNQLV